MGIMWHRDAASITTTITTTIIAAAVAARPRTIRRRQAGRLLRCRMVREAAAANRTHFSV
jgi:hypothetical protein